MYRLDEIRVRCGEIDDVDIKGNQALLQLVPELSHALHRNGMTVIIQGEICVRKGFGISAGSGAEEVNIDDQMVDSVEDDPANFLHGPALNIDTRAKPKTVSVDDERAKGLMFKCLFHVIILSTIPEGVNGLLESRRLKKKKDGFSQR